MNKYLKYILIILGILLVDQVLKTWIKTNMFLGQEFIIFPWFIIHFTENNGMAFGLEFAGQYGKLFLTVFRIIAVIGIGYGLHYIIKHNYHKGLILCVSLILAGAIGNIIDSVFYGVIYDYAPLLYGRVVDMFYFPVIQGTYPSWFPFWAGDEFIFFRPVFNIADAAISVGVITILIFQKQYFKEEEEDNVAISESSTNE